MSDEDDNEVDAPTVAPGVKPALRGGMMRQNQSLDDGGGHVPGAAPLEESVTPALATSTPAPPTMTDEPHVPVPIGVSPDGGR